MSSSKQLFFITLRTDLSEVPAQLMIFRDNGELLITVPFKFVILDSVASEEEESSETQDAMNKTSSPDEFKSYQDLFDFETPSELKTKKIKGESETSAITLREVDQLGKATLKFGEELMVPSYRKAESRSLQDALTLPEIVDRTVLLIKIDSQVSREKTEVDWTPLEFTSTKLVLQLHFEEPLSISTIQQQSLSIEVLQPLLFVTKKFQLLLDGEPDYQMSIKVPTQLASQEDQVLMEGVQTTAEHAFGAGFVLTVIVSLVAQRALKHIWVYYAAL